MEMCTEKGAQVTSGNNTRCSTTGDGSDSAFLPFFTPAHLLTLVHVTATSQGQPPSQKLSSLSRRRPAPPPPSPPPLPPHPPCAATDRDRKYRGACSSFTCTLEREAGCRHAHTCIHAYSHTGVQVKRSSDQGLHGSASSPCSLSTTICPSPRPPSSAPRAPRHQSRDTHERTGVLVRVQNHREHKSHTEKKKRVWKPCRKG